MNEQPVAAVHEQFQQTLRTWISFLDHHTLERLRQQPRPGSWSLGQVYMHLIDSTGFFVEQMREAMATDADRDKDMHDNAQGYFRQNAFPDLQLNGPDTGKPIRQPDNIEELQQCLTFIGDEVQELVGNFETSNAGGKTRHPGLLYFTALEWLQYAEMHLRHHLRQKARIDDALPL